MSVFVLLPIGLSLCYSFLSIYGMPYCAFFFSWAWSLLSCFGLWVYSFHQDWTNFPHYFFKYFAYLPLSFLSLVTITCLLGCLKSSHWRLMPLLKTLLSLCFIFLLLCIQAHQSNELVYTVVLWRRKGHLLYCFCWKIPGTDEPGRLLVHGVTKRRTWLSDWAHIMLLFLFSGFFCIRFCSFHLGEFYMCCLEFSCLC